MKKILSKILDILSFLAFFSALSLLILGIIFTYRRLEKSLVEAVPLFIPFLLVFILKIVNIFVKKVKMNENLLFNFTSLMLFIVIILIGLRGKFDINLVQYYKYGIDYNAMYFSDNLSSIKIMLYCLSFTNVLYLIAGIVGYSKEQTVIVEKETSLKNEYDLNQEKEKSPIIEETNLEEL